jgi:hypothetical protein
LQTATGINIPLLQDSAHVHIAIDEQQFIEVAKPFLTCKINEGKHINQSFFSVCE